MDQVVGPWFGRSVKTKGWSLMMAASVFGRLVAFIPEGFLTLSLASVGCIPIAESERGKTEPLLVEARVVISDDDLALFNVLASFARYLEGLGPSRRAISTDWKNFLPTVTPNGEAARLAMMRFDFMMKSVAMRRRGRRCSQEPVRLNPSFN